MLPTFKARQKPPLQQATRRVLASFVFGGDTFWWLKITQEGQTAGFGTHVSTYSAGFLSHSLFGWFKREPTSTCRFFVVFFLGPFLFFSFFPSAQCLEQNRVRSPTARAGGASRRCRSRASWTRAAEGKTTFAREARSAKRSQAFWGGGNEDFAAKKPETPTAWWVVVVAVAVVLVRDEPFARELSKMRDVTASGCFFGPSRWAQSFALGKLP